MAEQKPDIFRLYLANMEQQLVFKRAFILALVIIAIIDLFYMGLYLDSFNGVLYLVLFLILIYFAFSDLVSGFIAFKKPEQIIKWVGKRKLKEPDKDDAGQLAIHAAKKLRNGNTKECRESLNTLFQIEHVAAYLKRFAYLILADAQRQEGDPDKCIKTLRFHVTRDEKDCFSMFVLGRAFLEKGKYKKALETLEEARDYFLSRDYGIPDLLRSKLRIRPFRISYQRTFEVFIPYYLSQAHLALGNEDKAADYFNSAYILCKNKHLRPYL